MATSPLLPLHKLLLCLEWLPTWSLLQAEICCKELRKLSWQRGLFPKLQLSDLCFRGSFQLLLLWLEKRASYAAGNRLAHLESIDLHRLPMLTDQHVHRLLKLCPNLRSLNLSGNEESLTEKVLDILREMRPSCLQTLALPLLRASHFRIVCTLGVFPSLTKLELPLHVPVTSAIVKAEALQSLRLYGPLQDDLMDLIGSGKLAHLEELFLSTCPSRVVASAAKACPLRAVGIPVDPPCAAKELAEIIQATGKRLESLSIPSRVQPLVGPDLGALLAEHCPNLSTLCINSEKVLTGNGVMKLMQSCLKLHTLELAYVQGHCVQPDSDSSRPVTPSMRRWLEISSCQFQSISESPMAHWLDGTLVEIKLERLPLFSPSEEEVQKMVAACQDGLWRLRLAHLPRLPDWALSDFLCIPVQCLELCALELCSEALHQIPKLKGLKQLVLQSLKVSSAQRAEDALLEVVQQCEKLRKLDLYQMHGVVTDRLCLALMHSNRDWRFGKGLRYLRLDLRYGQASEEVLQALKATSLVPTQIRIIPQDKSQQMSVLPKVVRAQAQIRGFLVRRQPLPQSQWSIFSIFSMFSRFWSMSLQKRDRSCFSQLCGSQ